MKAHSLDYLMDLMPGFGWFSAKQEHPATGAVAGNGQIELGQQLAKARAGFGKNKLVCLAVCAHCDDEALGPGALLHELQRLSVATVFVLILAADNTQRRRESQKAALVLGLDPRRLLFASFPDRNLQLYEAEISDVLRWLRDELQPSLVITHRADAHPDHCVACRAVLGVFGQVSGASILHFKIPQHLMVPWRPNVFVRVSARGVRRKLCSFRAFRSQRHKDYFDRIMHRGLLIEAGHSAKSEYAEAYETDQLFLGCKPDAHHVLTLATTSSALHGTPDGGNGLPAFESPCLKVDREDARVVLGPCECGCGTVVLAGRPLLIGD